MAVKLRAVVSRVPVGTDTVQFDVRDGGAWVASGAHREWLETLDCGCKRTVTVGRVAAVGQIRVHPWRFRRQPFDPVLAFLPHSRRCELHSGTKDLPSQRQRQIALGKKFSKLLKKRAEERGVWYS